MKASAWGERHLDTGQGIADLTFLFSADSTPDLPALEPALTEGLALPNRRKDLSGKSAVTFLPTGPKDIRERYWRTALPDFAIFDMPLGKGRLGLSPLPGRGGRYQADLTSILKWRAGLVLTMTTREELDRHDAGGLGEDLTLASVAWRHLPIRDFGKPSRETEELWPEASATAHQLLAQGGRVLVHCHGGCGRSGMAAMRLMVEAGEEAEHALQRLRRVRSCAVETEAQRAWAARPTLRHKGEGR